MTNFDINSLNAQRQTPIAGTVDLVSYGSNVVPAQWKNTNTDTLIAGQAVSLDPASTGTPKLLPYTVTTAVPFGFAATDGTNIKYFAGQNLNVARIGSVIHLTAGKAFNAGEDCAYDPATGKIVAVGTAGASPKIGTAYTSAAADGAIMRVLLA